MKIPTQLIEGICAEGSRYTLTSVFFDDVRSILVATNGHSLAVIPADTEKGDTKGLIPLAAWKRAREAVRRIPKHLRKGKDKLSVSMQVLKHRIVVRGHKETTVIPCDAGQFPKWEGLAHEFSPKFQVSLDADLLVQLSDSLCGDSCSGMVTLYIDGPNKLIGVVPLIGPGVGVLMPVRSDQKLGTFFERWGKYIKADKVAKDS